MDAFISFSSRNRTTASRLETALQARGLEIWLDESDIRYGALLRAELQAAILECRVLVLLWSKGAATSRWVNSEWLMALLQDRLVLPCVLDQTRLPQCLANNLFLNLRHFGRRAVDQLTAAITNAGEATTTPLAPLIRSVSPELGEAIATIAQGQQAMTDQLNRGVAGLDEATEIQERLELLMKRARSDWKYDPVIVNLDGYHLKNAYMLKYWAQIQAGVAPEDRLLERAERRFFDTLSIDPTDPSAVNGLGSILVFQRELAAAEFFIRAAIALAEKQGLGTYPAAESDLELVRRFTLNGPRGSG